MSFWQICKQVDARIARERRQQEGREEFEPHHFAPSTLDATAWLMTYAPDRLADWLARPEHQPSEQLEADTRAHIARRKKRTPSLSHREHWKRERERAEADQFDEMDR